MADQTPSQSAPRIVCAGGHLDITSTGFAGDQPTCVVRVSGHGPRGAEKAGALYLAHNASTFRRFAESVRAVVDGEQARAIVGYGRGAIIVDQVEAPGVGVRVYFHGTRGGVPWQGRFAGDRAEDLAVAFERAAQHLSGALRP